MAKAADFTIQRQTPYSRLIFGTSDVMVRFPLVLAADKQAYPNSQIFNPGGDFFVTANGDGRSPERCPVSGTDRSLGEMGRDSYGDVRNFAMPWSDTFCEWRGNEFSQPFCAVQGRAAMKGPHYGTDIRAWLQAMADHVEVVSVSDGVVVEVGMQKREQGPPHFEGFVVKVRSKHLIFVYRHLNPDRSPFRTAATGPLKLGDRVRAGQRLGTMGDFMGGPGGTTKHLHFEIEAPVPNAVLLGPTCIREEGSGAKVRICMTREKAPSYPSLIVAYFRERYGKQIDLGTIDKETALPVLPVLSDHELRGTSERRGPAVVSSR